MMREAFGTEALVEGFESLIGEMTCDPKDRHVLAAAVHGGADTIVTFNLKDFPDDAIAPHGIKIVHPDRFLTGVLVRDTDEVISALERESAAFKRPAVSINAFLATLTATVPTFANLASAAAADPPGPLSSMPALVISDEEEGIAAFGDQGDLTNPAQVVYAWWAGLLGNLELARHLTYDPAAWGDYVWAVEHLADRSLASKVLRAVDAPDRVAIMRFVPEVSSASEVFEPYVTEMTFVTLIRLEDRTWRVWGLGPRIFSARDIIGP